MSISVRTIQVKIVLPSSVQVHSNEEQRGDSRTDEKRDALTDTLACRCHTPMVQSAEQERKTECHLGENLTYKLQDNISLP